MSNNGCIEIPRDRLREQIDEILRIRGPHDCLTSEEDVITFAVAQLHDRVLKSRTAELERSLIWRQNLNIGKKKSLTIFQNRQRCVVLIGEPVEGQVPRQAIA